MPPIFLSGFPKEGLICNVHVDGPWNVRLPLLCWVALKSQGQGPCPLWHLDPLVCWPCFPSFCQHHSVNTFSPNIVKTCRTIPTESSQMDKKLWKDPAGAMATKGQKTMFPAVFPHSCPAQTLCTQEQHCSFKMGRNVTSYNFYILSCGISL